MQSRFFAVVLLSLVGCASSLQRSVELYERGDFRAAHEQLARVEPDDGSEIREAVASGIEYSTSYLLSQAWVALERGRGAKPYREAFAYYRAALAVMPEDHPRRTETLERMAELEREVEATRGRHRKAVQRLEAAAQARDYAAAIQIVTELVDLMRSVGVAEPSSEDVLELAEQAMGAGEHELAVQLVELADLVRRESNVEIDDRDMSEVARVAAALRYFARADEETEGGAEVRRPARRKSKVGSKPSAAASNVPSNPEDVAAREARVHLRRAREQWSAGNQFEALRTLDQAVTVLGALPSLSAQRERWQPARLVLIEQYIERGELALTREASAEARGWYERVLMLDPEHELARDRMRKLDKLQKLQSRDR